MEDSDPDFHPNNKKNNWIKMRKILITTTLVLLAWINRAAAQNTTVNGAMKYQSIHGLGVNINPQSWNVNPDSVKKVIDSLVTGLGATSFRLMFDDCDWELENDNNDPDTYNWKYYDSIYSAPRFTCVWNTIEYLNHLGISDITLSPDGATPGWMGITKLKPGMEAEYAETISSMVFYGLRRRTPVIHFIMISPINETTCGGGEGVLTTPDQFGEIYSDIAKHLISDKLTTLSIIGPDDCGGWASSFHAMISSPVAMSKIIRFGQHDYGDETKKIRDLIDSIKKSAYPDREAIMTEANASCIGCDGGTYNKSYDFNYYAGPAYRYILQHLNAGTNGVQIWEGYDSRYHHPNRTLTWSMWGIYAINDTLHPDVYTPRAHYYTFKQLFRFVKPGFKRIDISTSLPKITVSAFYNPVNGAVVITGKNDSDQSQKMNAILKNLSNISSLKFYYTDEAHQFSGGTDVKVNHQGFSRLLPPYCVFTLVSN
jgi:O-glycosyl hydrolase